MNSNSNSNSNGNSSDGTGTDTSTGRGTGRGTGIKMTDALKTVRYASETSVVLAEAKGSDKVIVQAVGVPHKVLGLLGLAFIRECENLEEHPLEVLAEVLRNWRERKPVIVVMHPEEKEKQD
jgi:hypothetical protein